MTEKLKLLFTKFPKFPFVFAFYNTFSTLQVAYADGLDTAAMDAAWGDLLTFFMRLAFYGGLFFLAISAIQFGYAQASNNPGEKANAIQGITGSVIVIVIAISHKVLTGIFTFGG